MVPSLLALRLLATGIAALIQLRGAPLDGGRVSGGVRLPLERARGGDTPVLSFTSPGGPVRLLLDTGASSTMVTPALASRLGLEGRPLPPGAFDLAGGGSGCGELRPRRTLLPPLELAGGAAGGPRLRLDGVEALLMPAGALPEGTDGVLGAPSLRLLPVQVDPRQDLLRLGPPALEDDDLPPGRPRRVALRWHRGVPLLRLATVAGPVEALADTGAEGLFLTAGLARRLHPLGPPSPLRLVGFCGEQPVQRQPFAGVAFPGEPLAGERPDRPLRPVEGIITDNPVFAQLGVEAIVGQELLRERPHRWRLDLEPPRLELW
jgi:hypothetical protein